MRQPLRRVLCIVPPTGKFIREDRCQTPIEKLKTIALRPPIDLLYAAAAFEAAGAQVLLRDYPAENQSWPALERDLRQFDPEAILLSITTPSLARDLEAATLAKRVKSSILTLAKGAHFNTFDLRTLEECSDLDAVMRGEYEHTCRELGEGRELSEIPGLTWREPDAGIRRNPDRPYENDLDKIPFPARHLARNDFYLRPDTGELQTTLVTNRGCPFQCTYCLSSQVSGTHNRYRSVGNVMAEIRECVERHGIRNFLFRSDLFTQNKRWVIELCQAILDSGLKISWACNSRVDTITPEILGWMKRAGCWIIAYGVERGDQASLDRMNKKARVEDAERAIRMTRESGIKSSIYILLGLPWDTPELIEEQVRFAKRLDADFMEIFFVYPFPGTPLYETCVEQGLLRPGEIPREAYAEPAVPGITLSMEELSRLRRRAMRQYYLRPRFILRTLAGARSPRELKNYFRYGVQMLRDMLFK